MQDIFTQLRKETYTLARLQHRLGVLRHVLEHIVYQEAANEDRVALYRQQLSAYADQADEAALLALGIDWVGSLDEAKLTAGLQAAHEHIAAAPTFTLYVPVELDEAGEALLGAWCRTEIAADVLLELVVDSEVIGGCGFIVGDVYTEHSLRTGLTEAPRVVQEVISSYAS